MTHFAWEHPESVGGIRWYRKPSFRATDARCTRLFVATTDIKPAGSKHQHSKDKGSKWQALLCCGAASHMGNSTSSQ